MNKSILLAILFHSLFTIGVAQTPWEIGNKEIRKTESGLEYVILQESESGKKPKMGDKLKVHYTGYFKDGKIFDSSVERNSPIEFPIGKGMVIKGWDEGLMLLHEGEKAKLIIPFHLAYGENGRGPIPPQSDLIFDVELLEIIEAIKPLPYSIEGKRIIETNSGLKYYVVAEGNGLKPVKGNKVKVHYTGYFENGEIFDSSVERGFPFEFEVGQGKVIKGWDEGLLLMKQGGKSRFLIPHQLAYGENTIGPIPGKSMLTFDVELIEVKN